MDKTKTILVADDHPLLLKGLVDALKAEGFKDVHGVENGVQALEAISRVAPEIAILDIEMPLLTGFEVIKKCKDIPCETKFIILTSHKEKGFVLKAKKLNISGYLLKDEPFSEIRNCIKSVLEGETYFSKVFDQIFDTQITPQLEKIKFLSPSERTIVRLIANNHSSKEIAELLSISFRTVQKHRANIISKLDLEPGTDSLSIWTSEHKELILSL